MIQAEGLIKNYAGLRAVDDVSFTVRRGEVVGFLGPNGAGKSTTLRMLTGFLEADSGCVRICGLRMGPGREGLRARARIGYLPERTPLYRAMRVDRYLGFVAALHGLAGRARRDALERVLDACDLLGYGAHRIHTLSKGYRQRVGLAQALISDPEVLVLDEPTSGLDPAEIVRVRRLIASLAREKTILMSTHVLGEIQEVCPRALMIAAGRIVADGSLLELARREGLRLCVRLRAREEPAAVAAELRALADVLELSAPESAASAEPLRFWLATQDGEALAASVVALAARRGWQLVELRHELPTLESLYLERTRGLERPFERLARRGRAARAAGGEA